MNKNMYLKIKFSEILLDIICKSVEQEENSCEALR